jgi:hypothetical protein
MIFSALITEISVESSALPESEYKTLIKQKFFDAVVNMLPAASIDYIPELVVSTPYTITDEQITLPDNFVKFCSLRASGITPNATLTKYIQVDKDFWEKLGTDSEFTPPANKCYYYVEGRVITFFAKTLVSGNNLTVKYIKHPTMWEEADTVDMYVKYHSNFVTAAKLKAIADVKAIIRGEQNGDLG